MSFYKLAFLGLLVALVGSCGDSSGSKNTETSSPRIKKVTKLITPKSGSAFVLGSTIPFEVESSESIDSIEVESGTRSKRFSSKTFDWESHSPKTGNQKLRVNVFFQGGSETHYPRVTFFSDVVPKPMTYSVVQTLPHDPKAYTQGYFFKDDTLIESTGQNGTSWLSKVNIFTGTAYQKVHLNSRHFGEGATYWNGNYYQLTYTSQVGFVYDNQLNRIKEFNYTYEGWGMTTWGDTLLVSDGTEVIHFLDPRDLSEINRLEVYAEDKAVEFLNELEIIDGYLYANIYQEDLIAVIDLKTGKVLQWIDLSGLLTNQQARNADVLNGIAYHEATKKLYVTGKLWPTTFEIKITSKP